MLLNVIPAFVSLVAMPFLPESPRYLALVVNDRDGAEKGMLYSLDEKWIGRIGRGRVDGLGETKHKCV